MKRYKLALSLIVFAFCNACQEPETRLERNLRLLEGQWWNAGFINYDLENGVLQPIETYIPFEDTSARIIYTFHRCSALSNALCNGEIISTQGRESIQYQFINADSLELIRSAQITEAHKIKSLDENKLVMERMNWAYGVPVYRIFSKIH